MTEAEFRRHGHALVDWVADYLATIERRPVLSQVQPGEIRGRLPPHPPAEGEPFAKLMKDVDDIILPGITHWQSPNFFAYFPANSSYPSILGELLSAGLGVQGMLWSTSPACTELETHVLDWLVEMLGLPESFRSSTAGGGVIQDTASSATLCALLAARERVSRHQSGDSGVKSTYTAYASTQAHSSVEKAMRIAGLGAQNLRLIPVDAKQAMLPAALEEAIQRDLASGARPCFVCATVGTTSSHAIDPVSSIGEICRARGLWLHVDAAMAGTAAVCPEFRFVHDGVEFADSYCFNPHKWMFVNFDCDCFYVADRAALIRTLSVLPEYLKNQATMAGTVFDYRDWQIPLGRRFRALKLWFVIRTFGVEGIRQRIRGHIALAQEFASWVKAEPNFELCAPHPLNLVCFRHRRGERATQHLLDRVNASGRMFISHTRLNDRLALRLCVGQTNTQQHHVAAAWQLLKEVAGGSDVPQDP